MNKSYVGMATCFICGEVKNLLLDCRLKDSLPYQACYDKEPCDKCKDFMKIGVILISVKDGGEASDNPYRTGKWCVIKLDAAKKMFKKLPPEHVAFIEDSVWKQMGLPTEEIKE